MSDFQEKYNGIVDKINAFPVALGVELSFEEAAVAVVFGLMGATAKLPPEVVTFMLMDAAAWSSDFVERLLENRETAGSEV